MALGISASVSAQPVADPPEERPRLVHADSLVGSRVNNQDVRELRGNVQIVQGDAFIQCDKARWWESDDKIILRGNVDIYDGKRTLTADRVDYDGLLKTETASGRVSLRSGERLITAKRLVYSQEQEFASAFEDVVLKDFVEQAVLNGTEAEYDKEADYGKIFGFPRLVRTDSLSNERLIVDGLTMEVWGADERVVITDSVEIEKGDMTAFRRKAEYRPGDDLLILEDGPMVHHRYQTMRGDRIDVLLEGIAFKGGILRGHGEIVSKDSLYEDILTGEIITIEASEDTIRTIVVDGQATSVYHVQDEESGEEGKNTVTGDRIVLDFDGEQLVRVHVQSDPGQCTGVYEAESAAPDTTQQESRETKRGARTRTGQSSG